MSDPIEIPGPPRMPGRPSLDPRNPKVLPWWVLAMALIGAGELRAQVMHLQGEMDAVKQSIARIEQRLTPGP